MVYKFINEQMDALAIPYEFGAWTSVVQYPYFVGEFTPEEPMTEDGLEEGVFLLTGTHRGRFSDLMNAMEKIKSHFNSIYGLRAKTDSGAIAVFFMNCFVVPTGEAELKRIQINLRVKQWKGAI